MSVRIITPEEPAPFTVTLSTSIESDTIRVAHGEVMLEQGSDALVIKMPMDADGIPQPVRVDVLDPDGGAELLVAHEDVDGNSVSWSRRSEPSCCSYTWGETTQDHAVTVRDAAAVTEATEPAAEEKPKPKTIYIRVRPESDLPDPTMAP